MFFRSTILLTGISLFTSGCGSTPGAAAPQLTNTPMSSATTPEANNGTNIAACRALSNDEILAVQGETVRETKGNLSTNEGLAVSHCVYLLPTYSKSLSVDIMRAVSFNSGENALEKFWDKRFGGNEKQEGRDEERERAAEKARAALTSNGQRRGELEEEEMGSQLHPVAGVGDEAFWVGSGVKGALYVRKDDAVLVLSIGGAEAESSRIKKTTLLAQHALKHIQ